MQRFNVFGAECTYEYGSEEWLLVLDGRPTLRHPDGEDALERGDLVCFPNGPGGAHKLTNAVFPDSDKLGVWSGDEGDNLIVERASGVGYWHREA